MSVDFNEIKRLVEARNEFLAENPQYLPLQEKINEVLKNAGNNSHNRQVALQKVMLDTWYQVVEVWEGKS